MILPVLQHVLACPPSPVVFKFPVCFLVCGAAEGHLRKLLLRFSWAVPIPCALKMQNDKWKVENVER